MKMKKKFLSVAVLAAMAAGSAQAVNVGTDGTGQVLLFPYYTVQGGNKTLLSVVNTTDYGKAVKIRFREAYNSREVLDFNIYMSPHDVWVGEVSASSGGGAKIFSPDNTCTVPLSISQHIPQDFKTNAYAGTNTDTLPPDSGPQGIERTREGYVEVIEMGVPDESYTSIWNSGGTSAIDYMHDTNQMPDYCKGIADNFIDGDWPTGVGVIAPLGFTNPTGGLFGSLAIINVQAGTEVSVNATTLEDVYEEPVHFSTGSLDPSLMDANPNSAVLVNDIAGLNGVADEPRLVKESWPANELGQINAVSAVLMAQNVMNEYTVNPVVEAESAWVLTFPTKWRYVDEAYVSTPMAPFVSDTFELYGAVDGKACENVSYRVYDREEQTPGGSTCQFSPCEEEPVQKLPLCYETNVVQFTRKAMDGYSERVSNVFSAQNTVVAIPAAAQTDWTGWMTVDMADDPMVKGSVNRTLVGSASTYNGLPVIGFSASVLNNSNVGVGAAYGTSNPHVYKRVVSGQGL